MTKKDDKPQSKEAQAESQIDALQALVTLFTIYQLREHRGEANE